MATTTATHKLEYVLPAGKDGHVSECVCGWSSAIHSSGGAAVAAFEAHREAAARQAATAS